jgi:hypothetical protein
MLKMSKEYFTERQNIQKLWFWVIGIDLLIVGVILSVVMSKTSTSLENMIPPMAIVVVAFGFVIWIINFSKLTTVFEQDGIRYRYPVFHPKWKKINKEEIKSFTIKNYDAIYEYGGWGIKNSKKNGKSITIQGNTGLALELKNGERVLIGLRDKENVAWAMKRMMQLIPDDL